MTIVDWELDDATQYEQEGETWEACLRNTSLIYLFCVQSALSIGEQAVLQTIVYEKLTLTILVSISCYG